MRLEEQFHAEMIRICTEAIEGGYTTKYVRDQVQRNGGLIVARCILNAEHVSRAFNPLVDAGQERLTVEALVLSRNWDDLFTQEELNIAKERLRCIGFSDTQNGH